MANGLSEPLEKLAANFILSQMIDRLLETTWAKYLPDSARDVFIDDMRRFARMAEKGPARKPSLDSVIRRQCGLDNHERVYGEDSCMCGAVDYLPSATEKARQ